MGINGSNGQPAESLFEDLGEIKEGKRQVHDQSAEFLRLCDVFAEQIAAANATVAEMRKLAANGALNFDAPGKEKKPHAIKAILTHFDLIHQSKIKDPDTGAPVKAKIDGAKDSQIIKRLIGTYGEKKLMALIEQFFADDDPFIVRAGYTVGVFSMRVAGLVASESIPARALGVTRNTRENGRNAQAASSMIRQAYGSR